MKFEVSWKHTVEADSPAQAAFLAYQAQKKMPAVSASYKVAADPKVQHCGNCAHHAQFNPVSIAHTAPLESLTDREREVARLLMNGAGNSDIALDLGITPRTVKAHIGHMFEKLGVGNRVILTTMLLRTLRDCPQ